MYFDVPDDDDDDDVDHNELLGVVFFDKLPVRFKYDEALLYAPAVLEPVLPVVDDDVPYRLPLFDVDDLRGEITGILVDVLRRLRSCTLRYLASYFSTFVIFYWYKSYLGTVLSLCNFFLCQFRNPTR